MLRVGIWVESFKCAGILPLQCKVKTLRIDNIWNFAIFNLYTVPEKILYLQKCSTDFQNFCLSSKMLMVSIWVESFRCAGSLLLQWQGENFAHRQHLKFCHFQLVHWGSKILYLQRYSNDLRNLCLSSKMLRGGIWVGKFQVRRYFTFAIARRKLCASTTFEILPLTTCTLRQQKSYTTKSIQLIFEIFAWARRCWGWAFGWKVSGAEVFYFCNGKEKTLRIDNIWNFATFNLYTQAAKFYISKGIQTIFEIFAWARRCWEGAFGWKVSGAQVFYFCNGKVKTLGIDNIWNFATFNLFNVPAKIPYLQKYSTDFRNLCLSSKMLRVGIWVESVTCAGSLLLQWQCENFGHRKDLNFWHFRPVHCASKNPISPKVFNRFSKSLPQLENL